jgi:hypothetical protein
VQDTAACRGYTEQPFSASASFGSSFAHVGVDQALLFQALQGGMYGACGNGITGSFFQVFGNYYTIGFGRKYGYGKQHKFFKFAQVASSHKKILMGSTNKKYRDYFYFGISNALPIQKMRFTASRGLFCKVRRKAKCPETDTFLCVCGHTLQKK